MISLPQKRNHNIAPDEKLQLLKTLVFVGLMGAGKTNIGRRIAQRLNVPFFDSDQEVELAAGMCVSDIFSAHGEAAFRDAERKIIGRLLKGPLCVIATGGGAYMNEQTREAINQAGTAVWLRASLEVLCARTARSKRRPLLANGDAAEVLAALIEKRYPFYALAEVIIDSEDQPPEKTTVTVLQTLIDEGIITIHE